MPKRYAATAGLCLAFLAPSAFGQMSELNMTAVEIAQLPQFCWEQMGVPNATGPAFKPQGCGAGTNHYCPGLVYLIRAKQKAGTPKAIELLNAADADVRYTEKWIQGYPSCSIRSHVEKTKIDVAQLKQMLATVRSSKKTK